MDTSAKKPNITVTRETQIKPQRCPQRPTFQSGAGQGPGDSQGWSGWGRNSHRAAPLEGNLTGS